MHFVPNLEPTEQVVPAVGSLHDSATGATSMMPGLERTGTAMGDVRDVAASGHHEADAVLEDLQGQEKPAC